MKYVTFTNPEKIEMFDKIADMFYNKNFGRTSKSDIELLMFHFYIDQLINMNKNPDGTIDYKTCSDYKISHDLGITQQKINSLKVKSHLIYPIYFNWKLALASLVKNARYDSKTGKIIINIPDPNLFIEIQNELEERGAYVETQLNRKILQIRPEYFIELAADLEEETPRKKIIKELKKAFKESGKEDSAFDEKNIAGSLINSAVNISTLAANLSAVITPANTLVKALIDFLANLKV